MFRRRRLPETPVPRRRRLWWFRWRRKAVYKAENVFPYGDRRNPPDDVPPEDDD